MCVYELAHKLSICVVLLSAKNTVETSEFLRPILYQIKIGIDQVSKGKRWIARLSEAMKDVPSCDKLRGAAQKL